MSKIMGVAAGAAPIASTAETLEWVNNLANGDAGLLLTARGRTLQALLAEPRLPKEPSYKPIELMVSAYYETQSFTTFDSMLNAYRALYAHLTKPATKTVEVWRLEYTFQREPRIQQFDTQQEASYKAECLTLGDPNSHHACIRITGPHTQEVPA